MSGARVIEVMPPPEPGQGNVAGAVVEGWDTMLAPLTSKVADVALLLSESSLTSKFTFGAPPPVGKKASRISAACWNWRSVRSDNLRVRIAFGRQVQVLPDRLASGARLVEKNRSMIPLGANNRAKSPIGVSRSLL